jgi:polysaccharide deacetylase
MPIFIPAYDVEQPGGCLAACRTIVQRHHEMDVPATFFIVSSLLDGEERSAYRQLLGDPRFETASHTVHHALLRDNSACGWSAEAWETVVDEVTLSKREIEDVFERPCTGLRTPVGFEDGLGDDRKLIKLVADTGYLYSSSQAWGPHCTLPAPFAQAHSYAEQGCPALWEFPAHGWHENVLKGHNATPGRLLLWPPVYPDLVLNAYPQTPEEEFAVHRGFVDKAVELGAEYVSLIWHPWSLGRFDPEMRMLKLLFSYVREIGCSFARFTDLRQSKARGDGND